MLRIMLDDSLSSLSSLSSSEGEEELPSFDLKICTEYLKRIKIVQEELDDQLSENDDTVRTIFPVILVGDEWNGIRDEEIEEQLLDDVLKFLCSPDNIDEFISMSKFIDLYFDVMATSTSICLSSHTKIIKSIDYSFNFYVALMSEDRYSDSKIIYENTVLSNFVKYLLKLLGEMSKYAKILENFSLFHSGIAILDKYLLKLVTNQRIQFLIDNSIFIKFTMNMFNLLLPPYEEVERDTCYDSCTLICSTLAKFSFIKEFAHNFILQKLEEHQNQTKKLWNSTYQISILIGLFDYKGCDEFLYSNLQHENELIPYTCIWSLGVVCEDKESLVTKLQDLFIHDNRKMVKRSILKIYSTFIMKDYISMDMYDSIFNSLPYSAIDDLKSKSNDDLITTWFLMIKIIRKSQNRDVYISRVIELFSDLEKSMTLQCTECGGYSKIDPKFKNVHAVYFKLLSDKKVLKYLENKIMTRRFLRESVFVSLRRMVFSAEISDRNFADNLESYLGLVVGLMDSEMIRYMKEEQHVVTKCLFKVNLINKNVGNSFYSLISQLGVHLESFLTTQEINSLLTERMLNQIPNKISRFSSVEGVMELLYMLNSIGEVLRKFGYSIVQDPSLKVSLLESLGENVIDVIHSKTLVEGFKSFRKSVDVIVMVKSIFCNLISKIYCYCDQELILKNFRKLRGTILFFPELPHLRMGEEQLEYFASFVDILEHITNTDERIDFDFLQNTQLLERAISILYRFKNATDAFYFRAELGVINEGESLTQHLKMLVIKSVRLKILLETQVRDLENA